MTGVIREKRRTPRIQPFVAACRLAAGDRRVVGYLTDLSPLGCQVSCDSELPPVGASVVVEARLGRSRAVCRLEGTVKWVEAAARGKAAGVCGLTFEGLAPEAQQTLKAIVEEFRRHAAQLA